jgi:protein AbiQ
MENIRLYEISPRYINYLCSYEPHLFHNKQTGQNNERKYIGVVLYINGFEYFAPLSSFKIKHDSMKEGIDFLKIKKYAVINLNNMFPVPSGLCKYVDINSQKNPKYKSLLLAEYRAIKSIQEKIRKNAKILYNLKVKGDSSPLSKRCNDFLLLEKACKEYKHCE